MKTSYKILTYTLIFLSTLVGIEYPIFAKSTDSSVVFTDADADGVEDTVDLCLNTPAGTSVNKHGCPIELTNCDYNTNTIQFNIATAPPINKSTIYLLVDAQTTNIIAINNTTSFSGFIGSKTYMLVSFSYEDDASLTGLFVGAPLSNLKAACSDFSNALPIKVCSPLVESNLCDTKTSSISLKLSESAPPNTQYVLINKEGVIQQISPTASFSNLSIPQLYNAFAFTYNDDGSLNNFSVGKNIAQVTANCFDWSNPLPIRTCLTFEQPQQCTANSSNITLNIPIQTTQPNMIVKYLLVDQTSTIKQINTIPSFTNLQKNEPYNAYAVAYINDGSINSLQVGNSINTLIANQLIRSNPVPLKVCFPFSNIEQCNLSEANITFNNPSIPNTQYLLVNSSNTIVQLSNTPQFTNLNHNQPYNAYAVSYQNDNSLINLSIGQNLNNIKANCFDWSEPYPLKACICQPICIPITITKTKSIKK